MNHFNNFIQLDINNFFNDIRFIGDKETGTIRICGQNIKIERNLLNIENIAALFEINPETLRQWIKTNKKHYLYLFDPEEYKQREEKEKKFKVEYQKIKEEVEKEFATKEKESKKENNEKENVQTKTQVLKKRSDQLKKDLGLNKKIDNIVDKDTLPNFMNPRLIIPAMSSLNSEFNLWLTMTVIGGMCFDDKSNNIFGFIEQFLKNKNKYIADIQREFRNNESKYAEEKKKEKEKARNSSSKSSNKSIVVVIPQTKTKLPYASTIMSEKASKLLTDSKKEEFIDITEIGNYKKMMEAFRKYLIEECKFEEDEVSKTNVTKLQLSAKFTQEFYKKHKDRLIEYIKKHSIEGTAIIPKKQQIPDNVAKKGVEPKENKEEEQLKVNKSQGKKKENKEQPPEKIKSKMNIGKYKPVSESESESDDDIPSSFDSESSSED